MGTLNSWEVVDANNNATPPDGWPENTMNYSDVNNTGRAVQGTMKRFFADINGSLDAGGVADAYTLSLNESGYTAYFDGMMFACSIPVTNLTATPTIDVNGIGPQTIVDHHGNAISAGELLGGGIHDFRYDGTNFRIIGSGGVAGLDTQFQFNNAGIFAGSPGLTYNTGTDEATSVNPFNLSNDLVLAEQVDHTSTPIGGFGYLWVRNDSPTVLVFTNSNGVDTTLGTAGTANPGGSNSQVQYNDGGAFGGNFQFTFDDSTGIVTSTGSVASTHYSSDGRVSADGLPVARWEAFPSNPVVDQYWGRNIELSGASITYGRAGDGVALVYAKVDTTEGELSMAVGPNGIAAGTEVTGELTARIFMDANVFTPYIAFETEDSTNTRVEIARVRAAGFIFNNGLTDPVGVRFPSTANPSTEFNMLDDYREGTWTPGLQDNSFSDAEGQVYDAGNYGQYTKIGRVVFIEGALAVQNKGTLNNADPAHLSGLPFPVLNFFIYNGTLSGGTGFFLNLTAQDYVTVSLSSNNSYGTFTVWDQAAGSRDMTIGDWNNLGYVSFMGFYLTDE